MPPLWKQRLTGLVTTVPLFKEFVEEYLVSVLVEAQQQSSCRAYKNVEWCCMYVFPSSMFLLNKFTAVLYWYMYPYTMNWRSEYEVWSRPRSVSIDWNWVDCLVDSTFIAITEQSDTTNECDRQNMVISVDEKATRNPINERLITRQIRWIDSLLQPFLVLNFSGLLQREWSTERMRLLSFRPECLVVLRQFMLQMWNSKGAPWFESRCKNAT